MSHSPTKGSPNCTNPTSSSSSPPNNHHIPCGLLRSAAPPVAPAPPTLCHPPLCRPSPPGAAAARASDARRPGGAGGPGCRWMFLCKRTGLAQRIATWQVPNTNKLIQCTPRRTLRGISLTRLQLNLEGSRRLASSSWAPGENDEQPSPSPKDWAMAPHSFASVYVN